MIANLGANVGAHVALTDENNRLVRSHLADRGLGGVTFVGIPLTIEHVAAAVDSTVEVRLRLPGASKTFGDLGVFRELNAPLPNRGVFESNPEPRAVNLLHNVYH